jgi:hypothetical protein
MRRITCTKKPLTMFQRTLSTPDAGEEERIGEGECIGEECMRGVRRGGV